MPGLIAPYSGPVTPTLHLSYKVVDELGRLVPYTFVVKNHAVFSVTIDCRASTTVSLGYDRVGSAAGQLTGSGDASATPSWPVPAASLNDVFRARDLGHLTMHARIKVAYYKFFLRLLEQLTRTAPDLRTLANPSAADEAQILASFAYEKRGTHEVVTHRPAQAVIEDLPCELTDWDIIPSNMPGGPPEVRLHVYLHVAELTDAADRDAVTRLLLAADYSRWFHVEKSTRSVGERALPMRVRESMATWHANIEAYVVSAASITRGAEILEEIITAGLTAHPWRLDTVVDAIRRQIDARIITSNHWGENREDETTESYQHKLSVVLAELASLRRIASVSPVTFIRTQIRAMSGMRSTLGKAWMPLQYGMGHCGEHADVSYAVIVEMMTREPRAVTLFQNVVRCHYANVDHGFVMGGFPVNEAWTTPAIVRFREEHNTPRDITVFDLETSWSSLHGEGFTLDPYLQPDAHGRNDAERRYNAAHPTAHQQLVFIRDQRRPEEKRTTYVGFKRQHPHVGPASPLPRLESIALPGQHPTRHRSR